MAETMTLCGSESARGDGWCPGWLMPAALLAMLLTGLLRSADALAAAPVPDAPGPAATGTAPKPDKPARDAPPRWAITVFHGVLAEDGFESTVALRSRLDSHYQLLGIGLSRRLGGYRHYLDYEVEGQVVKHTAGMHHMEFNAVFILRWLPFPWDDTLDTSLAFGEGISYATRVPEYEATHHEHSAEVLNYLLVELAVALPRAPNWSIVARVHHRSGIYTLIDNVRGASNFIGLGVKYRF